MESLLGELDVGRLRMRVYAKRRQRLFDAVGRGCTCESTPAGAGSLEATEAESTHEGRKPQSCRDFFYEASFLGGDLTIGLGNGIQNVEDDESFLKAELGADGRANRGDGLSAAAAFFDEVSYPEKPFAVVAQALLEKTSDRRDLSAIDFSVDFGQAGEKQYERTDKTIVRLALRRGVLSDRASAQPQHRQEAADC